MPFTKLSAPFDCFAEEFSATRTQVWPELAFFRDALFSGAKVLDLGCGNGKNSAFFDNSGCDMIGLDISKKLLRLAREHHPEKVFLLEDMRKLSFGTGKFDAVFAIASLHHLRTQQDRVKTLRETLKVLKAGGSFCGTVWNLHQEKFAEARSAAKKRVRLFPWRQQSDLLITWGERKIPRFYHAFTPQELEKLLNKAGFTDIEFFGVNNDQKVPPLMGRNICFRARKPKRLSILGVPFDMPSQHEALEKLQAFAENPGQHFVTTPNPEICVAAFRDAKYQEILQKADLSLPDGIGILWAGEYLAQKNRSLLLSVFRFAFNRTSRFFPARVSGSDIFRELCETSKQPIFLLGGIPGVAEACAKYFRKKGANIVGTDSGKASADDNERITQKINASGASVLFVAFGAPQQEQWICRNLKTMPGVRIAMGIGGSFDFVVGKQKRAPKVFRKLGIEWAWRLIMEPSRRKRIFTAVWTFPRLVKGNKKQAI